MLKKCIICGKYFEPKKSNQQFCSYQCKYENTKITRKIHRRSIDFAIDNIVDDEATWAKVPTMVEVIDAIHILMDCGINDFNDLPKFQSRNALNRYFRDKLWQISTA